MAQKQIKKLTEKILYIENIYKDLAYIIKTIDDMQWQSWDNLSGQNIGRNIQIKRDHFLYNSVNVSQEVFNIYAENNHLDPANFNVLENIELRDWSHNVTMDAHTDFTGNGIPAFTLSYYLTDQYEGGNIEFPDHNISLKPSAGSVVIFPSNIRHQVSKTISGRRVTGQDFVFEVRNNEA